MVDWQAEQGAQRMMQMKVQRTQIPGPASYKHNLYLCKVDAKNTIIDASAKI